MQLLGQRRDFTSGIPYSNLKIRVAEGAISETVAKRLLRVLDAGFVINRRPDDSRPSDDELGENMDHVEMSDVINQFVSRLQCRPGLLRKIKWNDDASFRKPRHNCSPQGWGIIGCCQR